MLIPDAARAPARFVQSAARLTQIGAAASGLRVCVRLGLALAASGLLLGAATGLPAGAVASPSPGACARPLPAASIPCGRQWTAADAPKAAVVRSVLRAATRIARVAATRPRRLADGRLPRACVRRLRRLVASAGPADGVTMLLEVCADMRGHEWAEDQDYDGVLDEAMMICAERLSLDTS